MPFKVNIRVLMALNKIDSVKELSQMANVSVKPIYSLYKEEGIQKIKLETLAKICAALNCKLSELIEYVPGNQDG